MIREIKILSESDIKKISDIKVGDTVFIVDEITMKKKSFIEKIKRIQFYEMSKLKESANAILNQNIKPLLVYLLEIKILGKNNLIDEVNHIKQEINIMNIKNSKGEYEKNRWFNNKDINLRSKYFIKIAKVVFKNKFENVIKEHDMKNIDEILNNYNSLNDFVDIFKMYEDWRIK